MKRDRISFLFPIVLSCFVFSTGCATTMKLQYDKPETIASGRGKISIQLEDERLANRGGKEPLRVGNIRNTLGMPFPLKADPTREPMQVVEELVADCLEAAGYQVVEASDGVPRLQGSLQIFWSDGYQHSRMVMKLPLELKGSRSATPVWRYEMEANQGVTWTIGYAQMDRGYSLMLEETKHKLVAQFRSSDFRSRYQSLR